MSITKQEILDVKLKKKFMRKRNIKNSEETLLMTV